MTEENELKKQLESIQKQLEDIRTEALKRKSSHLDLYWAIIASAFIGVLGNWMASFYFRATEFPTVLVQLGFALSVVFLAGLILMLIVKMREIKKR